MQNQLQQYVQYAPVPQQYYQPQPSVSMMQAKERILQEANFVNRTLPASYHATPMLGNLFHWRATMKMSMTAPSPYAGVPLVTDLYFPNDYPMNQPRVQFRSRLYHPNIDMDGNMPVLTQWSPTSTVVDVMPDHRLPSL